MAKKVRGKRVVTTVSYEEILADGNISTIERIQNVQVQNMGMDEIHVVINDGDEIYVKSNEVLSLGDIVVESIKVKEVGSEVRYLGVE